MNIYRTKSYKILENRARFAAVYISESLHKKFCVTVMKTSMLANFSYGEKRNQGNKELCLQ